MGHLDIAGWFLLFHLLVFLPWAAVRSRQRTLAVESLDDAARAKAESALPRGAQLLVGTFIMLLVLATFSILIALRWEVPLFGGDPIDGLALALAAGVLAFQFGLHWVSKRIKTDAERRRSFNRLLVPRTVGDWVMTSAVILLAAFAEEAAYRGIGLIAIETLTGSWVASVLVLSVAFAIAHALQGWKNACIVALFAASMHALVRLTGTLVLAMAVHAIFDFYSIALSVRFHRTPTA